MDDTKPKTQEEIDDETYKATEYKKNIFSFSKEQLEELNPLEQATGLVNIFLTIGTIAQKMKDAYVENQLLPGLGVKRSPDVKTSYDLSKNRIVVYEPRFWCSKCTIRRATHKYEDKVYCKPCLEQLRETVGKPMEKVQKEDKKEENKEKKKN